MKSGMKIPPAGPPAGGFPLPRLPKLLESQPPTQVQADSNHSLPKSPQQAPARTTTNKTKQHKALSNSKDTTT